MDTVTVETKKAVNHNAVRSKKVSILKRKGLKIADQILKYIPDNHVTGVNEEHLMRLYKNLTTCSSLSLYSEDMFTGEITYYNSHSCNNKNCPVCNYTRQKRIRRKYYKWFDENSELVTVYNLKSKKTKIVTIAQYHTKYNDENKYMFVGNNQYDVMHLTLTVPHYKETGFRGNKYYYDELNTMYWEMRRQKFWADYVYGGEYGIETTNTDNGLNIHIHSLIFVKRFTQSRNILHKEILRYWNKITVNEKSERTEFTPEVRALIKKSNRSIDDAFISKLNPMGGTLLTLETIFSWNSDRTDKVRAKEFGSEQMLFAVMEAISYHFEPHAFDKDSGEYDLALLSELMPVVYGKALYKKFGCLHGEKSLNINYSSDQEQLQEDLKDTADIEDKDSVYHVNEETGELVQVRRFFVGNPAWMNHYGDTNTDVRISISHKYRERIRYLQSQSLPAAMDYLIQMITHQVKKRRCEKEQT